MGRALPETSQSLLSALSEAIGEEILFEGGQECELAFENGVELVLAQAGDENVLSLRSPLTPAGQLLDTDVLHVALALNYTHLPPGYDIALDDASGRLMVLALVDATSTTREYCISATRRTSAP